MYVAPSVTEKLQPGQRVDLANFTPPGEWFVQRLTDRSYWLLADAFCSTAYVGDEGVLLIDAPSLIDPEKLFATIGQFTDLPLTTLVYSHSHIDHNGGSFKLRNALQQQDLDLRIIASQACLREIKRYKNSLAMPSEVLPNGQATFKFEKWTFKQTTPVVWGPQWRGQLCPDS